jgi:hypothetical protein
MGRQATASWAAALLFCGLVAAQAGPPESPAELPDVLPMAAEVKDPVFAILVGLLRSDLHGVLTRDHLERQLARNGRESLLPYHRLHELRRTAGEEGALGRPTATVEAQFEGPIVFPIPYRILWYHPGKVRATATCVFREWSFGTVNLPYDPATPIELEDVHLFGLERGELEVDVDGWLDFILGSALDDTEVSGVVVFRQGGRDYGMAIGHNKGGEGRSGVFDLAEDKIAFPVPAEMKLVARNMRRRLEALMGDRPPTDGKVSGGARSSRGKPPRSTGRH